MLIESAHYIEEHFRKKAGHINVSLFGQEKNLSTWAICKLNMIFHNLTDADILKGDTLDNPKHLVNNELKTFDRVIANPPFSQVKWWDRAEVEVKKSETGKEVSLNSIALRQIDPHMLS
jgi:type I restriction enzyme M protein